jgi:hypothetical protein
MGSRRTVFVALAALAALSVVCGMTGTALAQEDGRISGVVRDASGAGLPGATVTVTNQATNASQAVTAGADGRYSVSVPPGTYAVARR